MLRLACRLMQPPEAAEDVVQQTLLTVLEQPQAWAQADDPRLYVFGVLKHKIADALRQRYRQPQSISPEPEEDFDELLFKANGHWLQANAPVLWSTPELSLHHDQFFAMVDACVNLLPDKSAKVFGMKYLLELQAQEVCEALHLSKTDYWQCLSRARKQLQMCLQQRGVTGVGLA